jgi:hypothetical protein
MQTKQKGPHHVHIYFQKPSWYSSGVLRISQQRWRIRWIAIYQANAWYNRTACSMYGPLNGERCHIVAEPLAFVGSRGMDRPCFKDSVAMAFEYGGILQHTEVRVHCQSSYWILNSAYDLTNSMKLRITGEATSCAATHEISSVL